MVTSRGIRHEALTDRQERHQRTLKNWIGAGLDDGESAKDVRRVKKKVTEKALRPLGRLRAIRGAQAWTE